RAITRQDRNRLHRLAFDLRLAGRCERAEIIDPAGNEILHRGRRTAIGDVGDVDAHRGVELRAGQMGSRPHSGRAVLHLSLAFAYAMNSCRLLAGKSLRATSSSACSTTSATGAKSVAEL